MRVPLVASDNGFIFKRRAANDWELVWTGASGFHGETDEPIKDMQGTVNDPAKIWASSDDWDYPAWSEDGGETFEYPSDYQDIFPEYLDRPFYTGRQAADGATFNRDEDGFLYGIEQLVNDPGSGGSPGYFYGGVVVGNTDQDDVLEIPFSGDHVAFPDGSDIVPQTIDLTTNTTCTPSGQWTTFCDDLPQWIIPFTGYYSIGITILAGCDSASIFFRDREALYVNGVEVWSRITSNNPRGNSHGFNNSISGPSFFFAGDVIEYKLGTNNDVSPLIIDTRSGGYPFVLISGPGESPTPPYVPYRFHKSTDHKGTDWVEVFDWTAAIAGYVDSFQNDQGMWIEGGYIWWINGTGKLHRMSLDGTGYQDFSLYSVYDGGALQGWYGTDRLVIFSNDDNEGFASVDISDPFAPVLTYESEPSPFGSSIYMWAMQPVTNQVILALVYDSDMEDELGRAAGILHRSADGGFTWDIVIPPTFDLGPYQYENDYCTIAVDPDDPNHIWVSLAPPYVFHSSDMGLTWTREEIDLSQCDPYGGDRPTEWCSITTGALAAAKLQVFYHILGG